MDIHAPRGTRDILGDVAGRFRRIEESLRRVCEASGYTEIRTPVFEQSELFTRGIGESTDIVEKEMYTFTDKGGRSMTLRPEGTAPVCRAYVEHNMQQLPQPVKVFYVGPMFRYERPQAGRYREHWQVGVEALGSQRPEVDVEVIWILVSVLRDLGIKEFAVNLNSIGCPACRPSYREALREAVGPYLDGMCPNCVRRFERNPLRILDCKNEECALAQSRIPRAVGFLCDECRGHHEGVAAGLASLGIEAVENKRLVRGFDYYTRTVFEVRYHGLGAQDALGGGGRYDGLVAEIGGPHTPGVGFAAGVDRIALTMEQVRSAGRAGLTELAGDGPMRRGVFVAPASDEERAAACRLTAALREQGIMADTDLVGRKLASQLKHADKAGFGWVAIVGDEYREGLVVLKSLKDGTQSTLCVGELRSRVGAP